MPIVADNYEIVIGVDTHAAAHALCVVAAATGAVQDKASFPASPAGLDRARTWIAHRAGQQAALVVIEGIGSYGAGLSDRVLAAGFPVAEPSVMGSADRRGVGKTDDLDAARIARSVLSVDIDRLRRPRADGSRVAMRVLVVAREQMTCERTRAVNALTALVRTVELGVDARKSLAYSQIKEIATWRARSEDATTATYRAEAVRLAKRIRALDAELVDNRKSLDALVKTNAPELIGLNRWTQHSRSGGCCGSSIGLGAGSNGQGSDEVTGSTGPSSVEGTAVLGADQYWQASSRGS